MDDLTAGDLRIAIDQTAPDVVGLRWLGKSNDRHPRTVLGPFLESAAELAAKKSGRIEMHFEDLEHFNSSTITVVIQFLQELRRKQVPLVISYNGTLKWQRLSFDALKIFEKGDELLVIKSVGE